MVNRTRPHTVQRKSLCPKRPRPSPKDCPRTSWHTHRRTSRPLEDIRADHLQLPVARAYQIYHWVLERLRHMQPNKDDPYATTQKAHAQPNTRRTLDGCDHQYDCQTTMKQREQLNPSRMRLTHQKSAFHSHNRRDIISWTCLTIPASHVETSQTPRNNNLRLRTHIHINHDEGIKQLSRYQNQIVNCVSPPRPTGKQSTSIKN